MLYMFFAIVLLSRVWPSIFMYSIALIPIAIAAAWSGIRFESRGSIPYGVLAYVVLIFAGIWGSQVGSPAPQVGVCCPPGRVDMDIASELQSSVVITLIFAVFNLLPALIIWLVAAEWLRRPSTDEGLG
jgi:hypothetical protein